MLGPAGYMVGEVGGPCNFSVSPRSKSFFFFFGGNLGACWDKGLDLDLDQGLTIYAKIKHVYKNSTH